jgi:hypothetical protein
MVEANKVGGIFATILFILFSVSPGRSHCEIPYEKDN